MKVQEKNITKTKTKRIINESSRKNITKTIRCGGGGGGSAAAAPGWRRFRRYGGGGCGAAAEGIRLPLYPSSSSSDKIEGQQHTHTTKDSTLKYRVWQSCNKSTKRVIKMLNKHENWRKESNKKSKRQNLRQNETHYENITY